MARRNITKDIKPQYNLMAATINGGAAVNWIDRVHMSDVVQENLMITHDKYDKRESHKKYKGYYNFCFKNAPRGSHFNRPARKLLKTIQENADPKRALVLFGKSLGAWNLVKRAAEYTQGYGHVILVTVDCNHGPRFRNRNNETMPKAYFADKHINLYTSASFLGGMKSTPGQDRLVDANHFTIVGTATVESAVREALSGAMDWIAKDGES